MAICETIGKFHYELLDAPCEEYDKWMVWFELKRRLKAKAEKKAERNRKRGRR